MTGVNEPPTDHGAEEAADNPGGSSLGFGLERIGFLGLRAPVVTALLVALFTAFTLFGLQKLEPDDALSELFRSSAPAYKNYELMSKRFPVAEFDVIIVVDGKELLSPAATDAVRSLHLDLELEPAVSGVLSMFSMRDPPDENGFPPPMFPDVLPQGQDFEQLMQRALDHPLVGGRFLTRSQGSSGLMVVVVALNQEELRANGLAKTISGLQDQVRSLLSGSGLSVQFAGAPVMQYEIRSAIEQDQLTYNATGFLIGFLICLAFFRRLSLVLIASLCPVLAGVWALGLLGHGGMKLNSFINVIPPLIMVIAFSDAMHLVFAVRRRLAAGADRWQAARDAVRTVGPACVLTSITSATAMLTLTLTDSALIRGFGFASAAATILAFVAVLLVVPVATVLTIRDEDAFRAGEKRLSRGIDWLEAISARFAGFLGRNFRAISVVGTLAVVACTVAHLQLEAHYRLSDQVPVHRQSTEASERLDEQLTGAHPLDIMIDWPAGRTISDVEVLDVIAEAHSFLESEPTVGNVWSVDTLRRWLREIGVDDVSVISNYLDRLPEHLVKRFINSDENSAIVTGRLPNLDAEEAVPIMQSLDRRLDDLRARYPDHRFSITGLSAVSAMQSSAMIAELNRGLLSAVAAVALVIALALRSFSLAALSFLPNLFAIVAVGALLWLKGSGLEYATVIALTVGFGLAVDNTIHVLARWRHEEARSLTSAKAMFATIVHVGPVLVLATLVIALGLSVTTLSDLPAMRIFGSLTILTVLMALIGGLVLLPAIVLWLRSLISNVRKRSMAGAD